AGETSSILSDTRSQLDAALAESADYRQRLAGVEERLVSMLRARDNLTKERGQLSDDLTVATSRAAELGKQIATLKLDIKAAEDKLAQKSQDYLTLAKDKDAAAKQIAAQQAMLKDKETLALAASRTANTLAERLRDNEANTKKLQLLADQLPKLRDEAAALREKLTTSDAKLAALQKDANSRLAGLQKDLGEQKSLAQQAVQARLAAENRFAGITLTGRRVVFLVDMSGSMEYVDEKTHAPEKWVAVRDTLVQIARSLPSLEKFQVVLFSDKASYLLGSDDR